MTTPDLGLGAPPWIVGHRGAAGEAPENTLDSLLLALDQGADMVEFDLQMTADGELVACHDWTLERMGDSSQTVEAVAFTDIDSVEVSGPFRRPGLRRVLATLDDVLTVMPSNMALNIELKRRTSDLEAFAAALAESLGDDGRWLISSFDWPLLDAVRARLPEVALAPLGGRRADPAELLATGDRLGAWSIHCRASLADDALIAAARRARRPVLVYTVNDQDTARELLDRGVQGLFTDFPGRLRRELAVHA